MHLIGAVTKGVPLPCFQESVWVGICHVVSCHIQFLHWVQWVGVFGVAMALCMFHVDHDWEVVDNSPDGSDQIHVSHVGRWV